MNYKNIEFQNHGLLKITCFAKRGMWFEKFATGSPPRHDAQLRLVNAQQTHLRGEVGVSLYTYHVICFPVFGSHLHNTCVGNSGECCRGQGPWLCTWVLWLSIGLRTRVSGADGLGCPNCCGLAPADLSMLSLQCIAWLLLRRCISQWALSVSNFLDRPVPDRTVQ